jgi:iron complex outermembrane recepter protein
VPVDVISGEDFSALGNTADITDNLKALIPSYTATPATADGSAFVRPVSLRGMASDQTLVLVNGKRRHRTALVQFLAPAAGNGSHAVDVAMIPAIALKSVEVLRDGAAAQYGSDAIAGVINFELKDANEGGDVQVQYGEFYDGESSVYAAANFGLPLGDNGFVNFSIERTDNDALSRGVQRPDAQALENAGVPGVGADAPFGESPLAQTWGRPQTEATRLFINSGVELANGSELYAFGNYADTDGRTRFFYRPPTHSTIAALGLQAQLPGGFTPFLDGAQEDLSAVFGLRGEFANDMIYDFSVGYGKNELDYTLNNTLNPGLALVNGQAQRDFDVGGYEQEEINLNADFSKQLGDNLYLSFGGEWREESFAAIAGEPNAVVNGQQTSGFRAPTGTDIDTFSRDNFAVYVDVEHDVSDAWLMQYALRYEDFSDFGSVLTGKIASRFTVSDSFTLRGAVSTGFHAPTPGQINVQTVITTFDGRTGLQVEEGLVRSTSAAARAAGGTELKEEEALNFSLGFAAALGDNFSLTVDGYLIEVDDRIYRTTDIAVNDPRFASVSFYTNAIDVESKGIDVVLNGDFDWGGNMSTNLSFAYSYNKVEVTDQRLVSGIQPVSDSVVEDIENNYAFDLDAFDTLVKASNNPSRLLVINSPHNPTGQMLDTGFLETLSAYCRENNIFVLSDEIYFLVTYTRQKHQSISSFYPEGSFVLGGLSKHLSIGGWRLGVAILPDNEMGAQLMSALQVIASETWSAVSSPLQYAAITAYSNDAELEKYISDCAQIHGLRTRHIYEKLTALGVRCTPPIGAFYMVANFDHWKPALKSKDITTSKQLAEHLLEEYAIASLPADAFGVPETELSLRLSTSYLDFETDTDASRIYDLYNAGVAPVDFMNEPNHPAIAAALAAFERFTKSLG